MQAKADDLIRWKTNAWQNPNMARWYAERMADVAGTNRLKNATEALLIDQSIVGTRILDRSRSVNEADVIVRGLAPERADVAVCALNDPLVSC